MLPSPILQSKVCNGGGIRRQIVTDNSQRRTILDDHVGSPHRAESIDHQPTRVTLNTEDLALAILRGREGGAGRAVVVEEAVQASSVYNDVLAVENA